MSLKKVDFKKIFEARNLLDISKKDLCENLNIKLEHYIEIEDGSVIPTEEELSKICNFLKLDLKDILSNKTTVLTIFNNKGGVGKSSVCIGLSSTLAIMGYKVLCIDLDAQRHFTTGFGLLDDYKDKNSTHILQEKKSIEDCIIKTEYENIDFIPSYPTIALVEMQMLHKHQREVVLKKAIDKLREKAIYDFIIIDTNPTLSMINFNAIVSTDYCIAPLTLGAFALDIIEMFLDFVSDAMNLNPNFEDVFFIINNYRKTSTSTYYKNYLETHDVYKEFLLENIIRTDINIERSQSTIIDDDGKISKIAKPLIYSNPRSKAVLDTKKAVEELLENIGAI